MGISLLVTVVAFLFTQGYSIVVEDAAVITECVDDHQFLFFYEEGTFDEAITQCESLAPDPEVGSDASVLASLQDANDVLFVGLTLFTNASLESVWVGIFRNANEVSFQFVDAAANANAAAVTLVNPASGFPFNNGEPDLSVTVNACLLFDTTIGSFGLSDGDCTRAQPGYVCRRNCTLAPTTSPTPAPTTSPTLAPTGAPTAPTTSPTLTPITSPTLAPISSPTLAPTRTPTIISPNSDAISDAPDLAKVGTIIGVLAFCCLATTATAMIILRNRQNRAERKKNVSGVEAAKDLKASHEV